MTLGGVGLAPFLSLIALLRCLFTPVSGPLSVKVRVTKGAWVGMKWRATQIVGSFGHSVGASSSGGYHCKAAAMKATIRGSLLAE